MKKLDGTWNAALHSAQSEREKKKHTKNTCGCATDICTDTNTDTDIIPYGYKILPAPSGLWLLLFFVSRVSRFQTNTKASLRRSPLPLCIRRCVGKSSSRPKWVRRRMSSRVSTPSTSPRRSTVSPSRRGLPVLWLRCVEERTSHHHAGFFFIFLSILRPRFYFYFVLTSFQPPSPKTTGEEVRQQGNEDLRRAR